MNTVGKTLTGVLLVGTGTLIAMAGKKLLVQTIKIIL